MGNYIIGPRGPRSNSTSVKKGKNNSAVNLEECEHEAVRITIDIGSRIEIMREYYVLETA